MTVHYIIWAQEHFLKPFNTVSQISESRLHCTDVGIKVQLGSLFFVFSHLASLQQIRLLELGRPYNVEWATL